VEAAVRAADIITTVTKADTALFEAGWVKPGCHIAAMGADRPGKQELPAELYAKARLFADSPEQSRQTGEFQHAGEGLSITAIGAVLDDPGSGRASAEDITVFDSSGLAIQDLMAAQAVLDALENHGR
jgi:ornithine cyclodeaminase